jgi:hypothetical protein
MMPNYTHSMVQHQRSSLLHKVGGEDNAERTVL